MVSAVLPRVQELNAFAHIVGEARTLEELPDEFFLGFSVILLTECSEVSTTSYSCDIVLQHRYRYHFIRYILILEASSADQSSCSPKLPTKRVLLE